VTDERGTADVDAKKSWTGNTADMWSHRQIAVDLHIEVTNTFR